MKRAALLTLVALAALALGGCRAILGVVDAPGGSSFTVSGNSDGSSFVEFTAGGEAAEAVALIITGVGAITDDEACSLRSEDPNRYGCVFMNVPAGLREVIVFSAGSAWSGNGTFYRPGSVVPNRVFLSEAE